MKAGSPTNVEVVHWHEDGRLSKMIQTVARPSHATLDPPNIAAWRGSILGEFCRVQCEQSANLPSPIEGMASSNAFVNT